MSQKASQASVEQSPESKANLGILVKFRQYLVVALVMMVIIALLIPSGSRSSRDVVQSANEIGTPHLSGAAEKIRHDALAADQKLRKRYPRSEQASSSVDVDGRQGRDELREETKKALANFDDVISAPEGSIQAQLVEQLDDLEDH